MTAQRIRAAAAPQTSPQRRVLQRKCSCGRRSAGDGECAECKNKRLRRRETSVSAPNEVPKTVHETLRSPGQPLDIATRTLMESRFGHSFADVRIHADSRAAESARDVNAQAYTVGQNVVFAANRFCPATESGRQLLAHELVHTLQQSGTNSGLPEEIVPANDRSEEEADKAAKAVVTGANFVPNEQRSAAVARKAAIGGAAGAAPLTAEKSGAERRPGLYDLRAAFLSPGLAPAPPSPPPASMRNRISVRQSFIGPAVQCKTEDDQNLLLQDAPKYPGCSPFQRFRLQQEIQLARNMIEAAIRAVTGELARSDRASGTISITASAISRYFHTDDTRHIRTLLARMKAIAARLARGPWNWRCLASDAECRRECGQPADACSSPDIEILLCPIHFTGGAEGAAAILIHEAAHQSGFGLPTPSGQQTDIYEGDKNRFNKLTPQEALNTPDAYSGLARDLTYGGPIAFSSRWTPAEMSLGGWIYVPGRTPEPSGFEWGVGSLNARIPATLFIENQARIEPSFTLSRRGKRPEILRSPVVSVKVVLRRASSDKERAGRPRESVLLDRHDRFERDINFVGYGGNDIFFDVADRGMLEISGKLVDADTATTLTFSEKVAVRPTAASGSNVEQQAELERDIRLKIYGQTIPVGKGATEPKEKTP